MWRCSIAVRDIVDYCVSLLTLKPVDRRGQNFFIQVPVPKYQSNTMRLVSVRGNYCGYFVGPQNLLRNIDCEKGVVEIVLKLDVELFLHHVFRAEVSTKTRADPGAGAMFGIVAFVPSSRRPWYVR